MIAALGCDAVELHALCAVLIIIRLSLGGENEAVVVLIPLAGKGAVIAVADIVALLVAACSKAQAHNKREQQLQYLRVFHHFPP